MNEILFDHFQSSNFYLAASEALVDNIVGGTAAVAIVDEIGEPLSYMAVPVNEVFVMEDSFGQIDTVFRKHSLTAVQIKQRVETLPQDLADEIENNASTRHVVIEAVVPEGSKFTYGLYRKSDWTALLEETSPMTPFVAWRWSKNLGSVRCDSPVRHALPHIRLVNRMQMSVIANAEYAALGAWQSRDETINVEQLRKNLVPGGLVTSEQPLEPLQFSGDLRVGLEIINSQQVPIRTLLLNVNLPSADRNSYMTASEVAARQAEFFQRVGQPAQRLKSSSCNPSRIRSTSGFSYAATCRTSRPESWRLCGPKGSKSMVSRKSSAWTFPPRSSRRSASPKHSPISKPWPCSPSRPDWKRCSRLSISTSCGRHSRTPTAARSDRPGLTSTFVGSMRRSAVWKTGRSIPPWRHPWRTG